MHVLHLAHSVSDHKGGGEAVAAYELAKHLAERGVDVTLVAAHVALAAPLPDNVHVIEAPGAEPARWGHSGCNKLAMLDVAQEAVRRSTYDAVHVTGQFTSFPVVARPFILSGCFVAPVPGRTAPAPRGPLARLTTDIKRFGAASVAQDVYYAVRHERLGGFDLARTLREADLVIVREAAGVPAYEGRAKRVAYVPFGVNPGPAPTEAARDGAPHRDALFVGRLDADKGVDVLVAAWPDVKKAVPDARLTIIGDGPERPALEAQARAAGVAESVTFRGHVPRAELRDAYATARVFALLSRGESFGQVNLEAMSAACPVVTTRAVTGALDYVEDGVNGRFVPVDDATATATALTAFLTDDAARRAAGAAARATAERFSWSDIAARHEALYRELAR